MGKIYLLKTDRNIWRLLIVGTLFLLSTHLSIAQVGNTFWFVAPEVSSSHSEQPIALRITAMDQNVTVTISMPADPAKGTITKTINAFQQATVNINEGFFSLNNIENRPNNSVLNKGLLVTSTGGDISVYYEVSSTNNPDIFSLKGESALGTEFYVPGQNSYTNHDYSSNRPYERVDIVATEDNTQVTIVPSRDILGGTAGTPITVTLNKGQTYGIVSANWNTASYTLAGTKITSTNNIAVTISDDSIEQFPGSSNAWDLIGDQIVPTSIIGTEYIAIKTTTKNGAVNKVYIMATADNTSVTIDGNAPTSLNKGQIKQIDITNAAAYIKSSSPVYVYQVSGMLNTNNWQTLSNEMGSALLPTIKCTGSKFVSFTRNFSYDYWVQIMTQGKSLGSFKMYDSGNEVATFSNYLNNISNWQAVPSSGTGGEQWYTATIPMSSAPFNISTGRVYSVENNQGLFHLGVLDMNNVSLSYGYYSSYSNVKIEGPTQTCYGEKVILESKYQGGTISWLSSLTGNTVLSTEPTLEVTQSGIYWVKLDNQLGCVATDSLNVKFNKPVFELTTPGTVCPNEPITFTLPAQYTYVWSNGATGNTTTVTPTKGETINLSVTATDIAGCATKDTVVVISFADDQVDLIDVASQVCVGDTIKNQTEMAKYEWSINGVVVPNYDKPYILASVSGTYQLTGTTVHNCKSSDTKTVIVNPLPVINLANQKVCSNTPVEYNGPVGMTSYLWSDNSTGNSLTANAPGTYSLQVTDNKGCKAKSSATVAWHPQSTVQINYQTTTIASTIAPDNIHTCPENSVTLTAPAGFTNYKWSVDGVVSQGPALTSINIAVASGTQKNITLEVTDSNTCTATDNTKVIANVSPVLAIDKAAYCQLETMTATTVMNSYEWLYNNAVVGTGKTQVASQTGIYTVRAKDVNGCVSQNINITSNSLPLASIVSSPVCASTPFVLTGQPATGVTYQWSQESTPVTGGTNYTASTFSVAPINTNKVWLEVTNVNGCKAKASAIPSWLPLPTVDISYFNELLSTTISANEINLCPEKNIVLNGTASSTAGITTYRWYVNGTFQAGNNTSSLNVTTPKQGQTNIRLDVIDSNGCTATDQVVLTVYADPYDLLTMPSEICLGQPLSVEGIRTSLDKHEWSFGGSTNNQYTFTPTSGGLYDLTIWDKNGCRATAQYSVNDPAITLTDVPSNVAECSNTPHTFGVVPKANYNYVWSNNSTGTSFTANAPGSFWVEATHSTLGCKDRETMELVWHPGKVLDLGADLTVCSATNWPVVVSGNTSSDFTNWHWAYNGVEVSNTNSYSIPDASKAGTYIVSATYTKDGANCTINQPFNFVVLPTDLDPIQLDQSAACAANTICLCEGEEITLTANNSYVNYQWYTVESGIEIPIGGNTASLEVGGNGDGTYRLKATQSNGCTAQGDIEVKVTENPNVTLSAPSTICEGASFVIENTDPDRANYQYEWVLNGISTIGGNSFSINANQSGTYSVTAKVVGDSECSTEESWVVSSPVKPNVVLKDEAICGGDTYDLATQFNPASIAGLNNSDWYRIIDASTADKLSNLNVSLASTYELRMNVNDMGIDCDYNYPMVLSVVDLPVLPVLSDYIICDGQTAQLNANADYLSYNWSFHGSNANGPADMTKTFPNEKIVDATDAGYYKVTAWTQQGALACSNISSPILLTVNNLPQITITPDKTFLCENGSVTMSAANTLGTPTTFEWDNGVSGAVNTVTTAAYYEVKATDSNGCESTAGRDVVPYVPTDIVLPDFPAICDGQTVTLPAISGVNSFQWFFNNAGNTEQGLPNQPWTVGKDGDYVVLYTTEADPDGCPIEKKVTITVLPLPVLTTTAPTSLLCDGDKFTLDAGNDYPTYTWTLLGTNGNSDQVVGIDRTYVGQQTGSYQIQAWTSSGCTSNLTVDVLVNANPNVSLGNDFSACVGETFTLSLSDATNLTNIEWSTGAKDVASITTYKPGTYTVKANSPAGCISIDTLTVTQFVPVSVIFPQIAPICSNDTYTLTSPLSIPADIQSYQWFFGSVGGTPQGLPNSPWTVNLPGNYILQITDLNGCTSEHTFKLATIPAPDFTLGPDREGCYSDTLRIVAKQSYIRYEWNGNPADNQYYKIVDPAVSFYSLEVEDRNGCVSTSSVNYMVNPLPVVNLGSDMTMCAGPITTLDPGGPYQSVRWSTGAISPTLEVGAGTFSVWVTDNKNCVGTDDITITWLPNPQPDLGPDELICPVEEILLDAGPGFQNYQWHSGAASQTIYANIVDTVNMVTVTDFNNCKGWDQKLVFKMGNPVYVLANDTATCANEIMVLDAGTEYNQFLWSTGETTQTIGVTVPGDYWVRATDGCFVVRDTVNVSFWDIPVVAQLDTMIYAQITILGDGGLRPYLYALNDGRLQPDSVFSQLQNGTYIAHIEDGNGCQNTDTVTINSVVDLDIPKFFTPNGDGFNDEWKIGGLERFPDAEVVIYDRYGKQVAKFGNDPATWDGRYLNKPMPSDDYWYVIHLVQVNKSIKGNLTLKR